MSGFEYMAFGLGAVLLVLCVIFGVVLIHPMPKQKPSKQPPEFKVINTTSHPCTVTVTSMGPSEYHITLSKKNR